MDGGAAGRRAAPPRSPGARGLAAAAALSGAVAAGACAAPPPSAEEVLAQAPVVNELAPGAAAATAARRATATDAGAAADRAEALLAAGDPAGALDVVRPALASGPPRAEAERLRDLRLRARRELVRTALLGVTVVPEPARFTEGADVTLRVRLRNLAPVPLIIEPARRAESPTLLRLEIERVAHDVHGNVAAEAWEESHPVPAATLPPGGTHAFDLPFPTARFRARFPRGFVEYRFGGTILPSRVAVGEVPLHERVVVEGGAAVAFPERWEEVARDPAAAVERGFAAANPVRILVAARCAAAADAPAIRARVARRLAAPPVLDDAMRSAATAALGVLDGIIAAERGASAAVGGGEGR